MTTFVDAIKRWTVKVETRVPAVMLSTAAKMHHSIKEGSPVTGAPGQPVDTAFLKDSWILSPHATYAEIHTNVSYARVIEDDNPDAFDDSGEDRPPRAEGQTTKSIKSTVGGHHSVKLTIAGASLLQAEAVRELGN